VRRRGGARCLAVLTLLLTLLTLPPSSAAAPNAAARQGIGELYLALGDSLGVGMLSSAPDARGYVAHFHALLQQRAGHPVALQNLSVSGETSASLIGNGQLAAAQRVIAEARGKGWTISPITLNIGGNDLRALQAADDPSREAGLARFRANVGRIFDALIDATTINGARQSDIVTMTVYNPYGGDPAILRSDAWWVQQFNLALTEEAQRRDLGVADVYARFRGRERELTWVPLDFHANNRGHLAMAEALWGVTNYDTVAPTVELLDPTGGTIRRAVPTIKVRADDDIGVTRVEFRLDDQPLPAPIYSASLELWIGYWDARSATPGPHRLAVIVTDAAGNATRREATVSR
jgi:lysophospholipase L1-like esterase